MDWITLLIEAVGFVILMLWIVIPIQEFREILRKIKARGVPVAGPPGHGFEGADARNDREPRA